MLRTSVVGTERTKLVRLTMSALEGKGDYLVARPDFSV